MSEYLEEARMMIEDVSSQGESVSSTLFGLVIRAELLHDELILAAGQRALV